ncbi:MAG: PAS domain-containing protein, partial [Lachnospiraceae bacterium]|nr:PAS domain-containing protein [Lachnospiraceae bacterium]
YEAGLPYYYGNEKMLRYLGYKDEAEFITEIKGLTQNCIHPEDYAAVMESRKQQYAQGDSAHVEYRVRKKDGSYIRIHSIEKKETLENGRTVLQCVCYDVTEKHELHQKLLSVKKAISMIVRYGTLGFWMYDLTTRTLVQEYIDDDFDDYAIRNENVPEAYIEQGIIYRDDIDKYRDCYQRLLDGAKESECVVRIFDKKKDKFLWEHIYLIRQEELSGEHPMAIGFTFDVNDEEESVQKLSAAQEELKRKNHLIEDLFENLPTGVVLHLWDGKELKPLYVSKGFSELCGQDGKIILEDVDSLIYSVVHPDDAQGLKDFILSHIRITNKKHLFRYRVWNKKLQKYIWVQLIGVTKEQPDGKILCYTNYINVDAEVRALEKLQEDETILDTACRFADLWTFGVDVINKKAYPGLYLQDVYKLPPVMDDFPESLLAMNLVHPDYEESYRGMISSLSKETPVLSFEIQVANPNGGWSWMRYNWGVTEYADGKPKSAVGYARFIDDEMFQRSRMELERQKIFAGDHKLAAYSVTDIDTEVVIEAEDFCLDTGAKGKESVQEHYQRIIPKVYCESDKERILRMRNPAYVMEQYKKGITSWECDLRWIHSDGTYGWYRNVYSILNDPTTGKMFLYCYLHDIFAEKMMDYFIKAVRENNYIRVGLFSRSTRRLYVFENADNKESIKVMDCKETLERYVRESVEPEDKERVAKEVNFENMLERLNRGEKSFYVVHRHKEESGQIKHWELSTTMVAEQEDLCLCNIRDVTAIVQQEEQINTELKKALAKAEKATASKTDFLARMSHDLRTPLNTITGLIALTLDEPNHVNTVTGNLAQMREATEFMGGLINDLLDMSEIESGKIRFHKEPYLYSDFLQNMKSMFLPQCEKKQITLTFADYKINPVVYVDKMKMDRIFFNVFSNAVKYTPTGGHINYYVENLKLDDKAISVDYVIEDDGIGMSQEFQEHMFETFTQEDKKVSAELQGSGLGLSISKQLVELMGGHIRIDSKKGCGTKVTLSFVFELLQKDSKEKLEQTKKEASAAIEIILKEARVLLVEDHPINAQIEKLILENKGVIVTTAENGQAALDKFLASPPDYYCAILMDIRMPVMDGLEATKAIRATDRPDAKTIPIIATSANAYDEDIKASLAAGMTGHISKPIDTEKLYQMLSELLIKGRKI